MLIKCLIVIKTFLPERLLQAEGRNSLQWRLFKYFEATQHVPVAELAQLPSPSA